MRRTIDKYRKAVLRETYTVNTHGCGVVRYYSLFQGKYLQGSGTLEEGSYENIRPSKHELNKSRSKRNFVAKLERSRSS